MGNIINQANGIATSVLNDAVSVAISIGGMAQGFLVSSIIGGAVLIFAIMVIGPMLLTSDDRQVPVQVEEDRIISIEPVRLTGAATMPITHDDVLGVHTN